jgi:hypothetical protein
MFGSSEIEFLNTDKLREWIPRLIKEAEKELVIIVPYIKTSDLLFEALRDADSRNVETTIVYKEESLHIKEKEKLKGLKNLNLLCHPNVHAKCFLNEKNLLITSINMYEYSENNNREMGILLYRESCNPKVFEDAIIEINHIITGSHMEQISRETKEKGFEKQIIKTRQEKEEERCKWINEHFQHKKFKVEQWGEYGYIPVCRNFYDRLHVYYEHNRFALEWDYEEKRVEEIFSRFKPLYTELKFDGYKFYWNHHLGRITLYSNQQHNQYITAPDKTIFMKNGLDDLVSFLREFVHG